MVDDGRSSSPLPRSILYVDPDPADRRRTVDALESGGDAATVEGAASAADLRDALAAESSEYACVVTEYRIGETDALALYDSVRADGRETVPVVLYTADGDEVLASDAIAAGFSGYAPKEGDDSIDRLRAQLRTVGGVDTDDGDDRRRSRDRDLERYRTLVETVGDSMYVVDADGTIEMANEAMAEALDEPREALLGTHVTEFLSVDDVQGVQETLEEIHSSDDRAWGTVEITVEFGDGERGDAEVNVAPLTDDDGTIAGSVGAIRDISARAERERRIRRLHDGTRRLMAATDAEGIARTVSEIACDALDLRLNSVYLYESDVMVRSAADASSGGGTDGPALEDETDGAGPGDETNGPADDDGSSSTEKDGGGLVAAAMSDRAAELFGGVGVIEPDGGIVWDAFEAGEAIVHGDVRRAPNVRNPETAVRSEAHIPLGDHGILIVSSLEPNDFDPSALTLARILAANAEAALDRAQRERELADRSRELERQNERLESFASTVSHDLRNPLTLAMGHLEALAELLDGDADADGRANADDHPEADDRADLGDHLEEIDWALERMDELIENVLTLARSGQRLTETEPVDLATVVECAHRTVDPALDVRWDDSLPTVDGDDARLRVLFENALRNAAEHAGADVTVTVEPTPEGFAIDDDGPGIAPEEREHVLEWGYSTATDGTGFGLAIVAEVVEAHGWSIDVAESEAGGLRLAVTVGDSRSRLE